MQVRIIMGSSSDAHIGKKVCQYLEKFGVEYDLSILSAHRDLEALVDLVRRDDADVYIGIAGMAAHLSGVIAGLTNKPVIAVPVKGSALEGLDALLASVQMPKGVPVATVAIDGGENAGILATQILALSNEDLAQSLASFKEEMREAGRKANDVSSLKDL